MPNSRRTSRRPSRVHHRPSESPTGEFKAAIFFWLIFEGLLDLLERCGIELFHWLREAMDAELIPGLVMVTTLFLIYTPASRYVHALAVLKTYLHHLGHTILKLRVEQILKVVAGHHTRTVLLWIAGTACIHFTAGCARSVIHRFPSGPAYGVPGNNFLKGLGNKLHPVHLPLVAPGSIQDRKLER